MYQKALDKLVSRGNIKVKTLIFNLQSATDCTARKMGLCPIASRCYALKAEVQYPAVLPYRRRQAIAWETYPAVDFIDTIKTIASRCKSDIHYLRVNESGDFTTAADIEKVNDIAKGLKDIGIKVYTYTHRSDLAVNINPDSLAFKLNISDAHIDGFVSCYAKEPNDIPKGSFICQGKDCMKTCFACANSKQDIYFKMH